MLNFPEGDRQIHRYTDICGRRPSYSVFGNSDTKPVLGQNGFRAKLIQTKLIQTKLIRTSQNSEMFDSDKPDSDKTGFVQSRFSDSDEEADSDITVFRHVRILKRSVRTKLIRTKPFSNKADSDKKVFEQS